MITFKIEDGMIDSREHEYYDSHKRGRNWLSINRGKNAANVDRKFLKSHNSEYDIDKIETGDSITLAADYVSSGGVFRPCRLEAVVVSKSDEELVLEEYPTLSKSMKARPQQKKTA